MPKTEANIAAGVGLARSGYISNKVLEVVWRRLWNPPENELWKWTVGGAPRGDCLSLAPFLKNRRGARLPHVLRSKILPSMALLMVRSDTIV